MHKLTCHVSSFKHCFVRQNESPKHAGVILLYARERRRSRSLRAFTVSHDNLKRPDIHRRMRGHIRHINTIERTYQIITHTTIGVVIIILDSKDAFASRRRNQTILRHQPHHLSRRRDIAHKLRFKPHGIHRAFAIIERDSHARAHFTTARQPTPVRNVCPEKPTRFELAPRPIAAVAVAIARVIAHVYDANVQDVERHRARATRRLLTRERTPRPGKALFDATNVSVTHDRATPDGARRTRARIAAHARRSNDAR